MTTIVREYPDDFGPGGAILSDSGAGRKGAIFQICRARAPEKDVSFVGRLATYRYYNMDQVVGMALTEFDRLRVNLQRPESFVLSSSAA